MNLSEWVGEGTRGRDLGGDTERRPVRIERCFGDGVLVRGNVVVSGGIGRSG